MAKAPAFQFYVGDFIGGVLLLTADEIGAYILLLCYQWDKERVPLDLKEVAKIARVRQSKLEKVMKKFSQDERGFFNERLEYERKKQLAFREKQAMNGVLGGRPKLTQALPKANPSHNPNQSPHEEDEVEDSSAFCIREGIGEGMRKDGFPDAWRDWRAYRTEKGEPLTSYTAAGSLAKCLRWGSKKATEIIRTAIERSWKNLIAPEEVNLGFGSGPMRESKLVVSKPSKPSALMVQVGDAKLFLSKPSNLSEDEQNAAKTFLRSLVPISYPAYFTDTEQLKIQEYLK